MKDGIDPMPPCHNGGDCVNPDGGENCCIYCEYTNWTWLALMALRRDAEQKDNESRKQRMLKEIADNGRWKVIEYSQGGACPVQGDGRVENGRPFFVHERHGLLTVDVGPVGGHDFGTSCCSCDKDYDETWTTFIDHQPLDDPELEGNIGGGDVAEATSYFLDWSETDLTNSSPMWLRFLEHELDKVKKQGGKIGDFATESSVDDEQEPSGGYRPDYTPDFVIPVVDTGERNNKV